MTADAPVGIVHAFSRSGPDKHVAQVTRLGDDGRRDLIIHTAGGAARAVDNVPVGGFVAGCDWYWTAPSVDAPAATEEPAEEPEPVAEPVAVVEDEDEDEDEDGEDDRLPF